jgi:Zn-dependent M28 family amino/carboxypeptidase
MPLILRIIEGFTGRNKIIRNSRQIVKALSRYIGHRSLEQYENLDRARNFIHTAFALHGAKVSDQEFVVDGKTVANITVELKGQKYPDSIIVIGAHYDTVSDSPGANDNASGIAALLEIHRVLSKEKMNRTVRLIAFVLEEPPFFGTKQMGSYVSALQSKKNKEKIELMIAFDMLGFGGRFIQQNYPLEQLRKKYPAYGNFLACAAVPSHAHYALLVKKHFNRHSFTKMQEIIAPASVNGIINSDHQSYHNLGYPAILLTDTGFYRSKNYHNQSDTFDTLNYRFLGHNIFSILKMIRDLANLPPVHFKQ